jgi:uncharacterized Tic20 family protein
MEEPLAPEPDPSTPTEPPTAPPTQPSAEPETTSDARRWAMLCHLLALSGLLGNGIGFLLGPLVAWLVKREDHPFIDDQGKEAVNFQITMFLALIVSVPFLLIVVGVLMMIAVGILMVVFPIIGAIQASEGKAYRYPLTIRFIQ